MLNIIEIEKIKKKKSILIGVRIIGWIMMSSWILMALPMIQARYGVSIPGCGTYHEGYVTWFDKKVVIEASLYFGIVLAGVLFAQAGLVLTIIVQKGIENK